MTAHRLSIEQAAALRSTALSLEKNCSIGLRSGAIRRKIQQHCAARFDCLANAGNFVNADVVHDDDVASLEGRSKDLLDIGQKGWTIHRPVQQEGRGDAIVA